MKGAFLSGKHMKHMVVLLSIAGMLTPFKGTGCPSSVDARSRVQLSATKRNYSLNHVWDKLTLKNVPSGARISWSSSNKKVVRIREHIPNGIWYQVKRDGRATVTAIYKGKRYRCRIIVKRETDDAVATPTPTEGPLDTAEPEPTDRPVATVSPPSSTPAVTPGNGGEGHTPVPIASSSASPEQQLFDQKIAGFKTRYITEDMSDYDKVDAICRFISYEFDYDPHVAGWFAMVVGGAGDCMASRIGVNRLCTELGIPSFICSSLSDHGETMVRIGDDVYMTVTGFKGEKPRNYRLYRMSEAELEGYLSRYPASARVLGLAE
ncbi:MAG: hypothetical protein J5819_07775 [Eubacterium sp.]|nr:hypothetical protein [Eubacterium sp.]